MKTINRIISLLLLLFLTACGTVLEFRVRFPDRPTDAPTSTIIAPTATNTSTATTDPTYTPTASPTLAAGLNAVTTANVNFRHEPSTNNVPIRVVATGTSIRLIGRIADNTWAKVVLLDGAEGWMYTQNLSIAGNINTLPIITFISTPVPTIDPSPTQETQRISYNINGEAVPDTAYLLHVMTNPCKTTALVMNNLGLAARIKELCPDTIVVSRNYSSLEGDEWVLRSAQNIVAQWQREGHPEIVRHSTNEPSFGRGLRLQQFVQAECELMRLARAAGFTVAMGNFSVGIFEASDIDAGLFDPYLRCLNQYGHYLALHEYSLGVLAFGIGQWQPQCLLDRLCVQANRWQAEPLRIGRVWSDGIWQQPPYWYLGRGIWWINRADLIGIARPQILVTEFGWDNLPNIKSYIEPLRWQYGIDRYFDDMRGVNTYQNLWAWYWPRWSFAQAACEQLKWADRIYPPEYLGFALFTWSTNPHWLQTDFSGRENPSHYELHQCLEDYSQN